VNSVRGGRVINITLFGAVDTNAIGKHDTPRLLLPRVHLKKHMLTDALISASIVAVNPAVWSKETTFVD
jgi:hypothetical protein